MVENISIGTPYDDVFRTLLNDCTSLIIPVVNEVFGEHYTGNENIMFLQNEHFINLQGVDTKEKITDSCFLIEGKTVKKYHIECQSTTDKSMMIRMFEYDSQIALDGSEILNEKLILSFPNSAVIYLRHTRHTPSSMTIEIRTPGGSICYKIPVMKTQVYTIDAIFDKNLLFLIPFHIFCYESRLKEYDRDIDSLRKLQNEYRKIRERLEHMCIDGKISEYVKCTIVDMSKKVIESIAARYANVKKGVSSIMGGKVLEYEAKTILQNGIREGIREGKLQGIREGRINSYVELIKDGLLSISEAAKRLEMSEEELKKYL
ncbi:MAG: hypothetical protein UHW97_07475 [Frisingicoccus sp.]|nr:hypothetical protein [Frisingicoccus sp.]